MVKSGNTITFHANGGEVKNNRSGNVIPILERNGSYGVDLWVPSGKGSRSVNLTCEAREEGKGEQSKGIKVHNRYSSLKEEDEEEEEDQHLGISMDFIRLDKSFLVPPIVSKEKQ